MKALLIFFFGFTPKVKQQMYFFFLLILVILQAVLNEFGKSEWKMLKGKIKKKKTTNPKHVLKYHTHTHTQISANIHLFG
jgi:hypothetical protein